MSEINIFEPRYSFSDVNRILSISHDRLIDWAFLGYIEASAKLSKIYEIAPVFSIFNVYKIYFFAEMINKGLSHERACEITKQFTRNYVGLGYTRKKYIQVRITTSDFDSDDYVLINVEKKVERCNELLKDADRTL